MNHSPLPWRLAKQPDGRQSIVDANGHPAYTQPNAAHIVAAVNSHSFVVTSAELLASLEALVDSFSDLPPIIPTKCADALNAAKAAISTAYK